MEKFAIGFLLGGLGGALLVANNYKMRTLVKKSQQEVQEKLDKLMDDKLRKMDENEAFAEADEQDDKATKKSKK